MILFSMEKFINIDGLEICYVESGPNSAPPVILMHGWGCNSATVASIQNIFGGQYHVFNVDLPGHGKSQEPPMLPSGQPWGVEEYAELIEKLMAVLGLENVSLVGHSYGGRVAIILSSRNKINKLVLVDAAGVKHRKSMKKLAKIYSFKAAKKMLPLLLGKKRGQAAIEKWRGKAGSADYRNSSPMMRMVMSRSVNQDLRKYMPEIKAPTLLIWGENDTATPLGDGKIMEKLIPDSGLVSFKGCGHYSFLDNPGQFRAVIKSFFKIN